MMASNSDVVRRPVVGVDRSFFYGDRVDEAKSRQQDQHSRKRKS
jgi:hypothetical protein